MIKRPPYRKLRGYAFDPSLSLKMDTAPINDIVYKVPWEYVMEGPIGEYIEVIDYDPTVDKFYAQVDLNHPFLLAQDGLEPSESNPRFHQQMVYAVAMTTIKNFEKALGRKILWSPHRLEDPAKYEEYVQRLRIYPHAMREPNAYYSPLKKALLFGYFASSPADETLHMPDSLVFTCLSHDIVAHETTHAILDGMYNHYNEPTNADMLAFHEAFADIVALFQHFTFPEVLRHQIARTRGDLTSQNLLGQLAQEFGSAIGGYGSLRDAIGQTNPDTGEWKPLQPDPDDYRTILEPHARGSILVAAVFDAFLAIYKSRVADLLRIASEGSGILRQGELHPDLVNRLAAEAAKAADHVLKMCIRALDYCPPVDLTFGDYLRGIITADVDLIADDNRDYRLAFIEAFRRRGIYPQDINTLSVESLRHQPRNLRLQKAEANKLDIESDYSKQTVSDETLQNLLVINDFLREYAEIIKYESNRQEIYNKTNRHIAGDYTDKKNILLGLHARLNFKFSVKGSYDFAEITGLAFLKEHEKIGVSKSGRYTGPSFQIQNLRLVNRVGPDGSHVNQVVFSIMQRSGVVYKNGKFTGHYLPPVGTKTKQKNTSAVKIPEGGFELRGACTLIFDLDTQQLKYAISKPILDMEKLVEKKQVDINKKRLETQYRFQYEEDGDRQGNEFNAYFGNGIHRITEPFAFLHQH